jgi:hypothetical protein
LKKLKRECITKRNKKLEKFYSCTEMNYFEDTCCLSGVSEDTDLTTRSKMGPHRQAAARHAWASSQKLSRYGYAQDHVVFVSRVARWYIFIPKMQIWVNF